MKDTYYPLREETLLHFATLLDRYLFFKFSIVLQVVGTSKKIIMKTVSLSKCGDTMWVGVHILIHITGKKQGEYIA